MLAILTFIKLAAVGVIQGTYPSHLYCVGQHDDARTVDIPHHPQKIRESLLHGACGRELNM